jgi:uncharacterized protein involved in exopolysaccharide biosynthesis
MAGQSGNGGDNPVARTIIEILQTMQADLSQIRGGQERLVGTVAGISERIDKLVDVASAYYGMLDQRLSAVEARIAALEGRNG